jgi:iron complex transport system ATP-binding protein
MIKINEITIAYGDLIVLEKFSAQISRAEITVIVGPNGSGKSSLLAAISGDIAVAGGEIAIDGTSIADMSREELAFLRSFAAQSHHYWMAYSTQEILRLGHDLVSDERFQLIVTALNIEPFLNQKVTALSGGQLQRVEIARAFMRSTPLVLLDEPFASQDNASIKNIITLIKSEKAAGRTIVVVAHGRSEDLEWADSKIEIGY